MGARERFPAGLRPLTLAAALLAGACGEAEPVTRGDLIAPHAELWARMLEAEDQRGLGPSGIEALREGIVHPAPRIRRIAVRALGRLERDDLAGAIVPALSDDEPEVRAEAANALAQAVANAEGPIVDTVRSALAEMVGRESHPFALGVAAASLGRVPFGLARGGIVARSTGTTAVGLPEVVSLLGRLAADSVDQVRLGAFRGLHALVGEAGAAGLISEELGPLVDDTQWMSPPFRAGDSDEALLRGRALRLAIAVMVSARGATADRVGRWLGDPDRYVRREAVLGLGTIPTGAVRDSLLTRALEDIAPSVRYEAYRLAGRAPGAGCARGLDAFRDGSPQIVRFGIDLLARCGGTDLAMDQLHRMALELGLDGIPEPAKALVALARAGDDRAHELLPSSVSHPDPFIRVDAAAAATALDDSAQLRLLADDSLPMVRAAAIDGLRVVEGPGADELYLTQLRPRSPGSEAGLPEDPPPQVAMAVARALEGSDHPDAPDALLEGLAGLTSARSQSSRDARIALMDRLGELGSAAHAEAVRVYLADFDPRVADRAADLIEGWTGDRPATAPVAAPGPALPSFEAIRSLEGAQVILELAGLGEVAIELLPFEAPTNAARLAHLAESGSLDGLTIHRVVPNFVVQGGSPGADEYSGHGYFSRDELGILGNWRGSVGLSTRGRDTGDGQFYINLVDNPRLDHEYTVFGRVVRGMEFVDRVHPGVRIVRARVER